MGMIENFIKGTYSIKRKCKNCKKDTIIQIPRGRSINDWLGTNLARCNFCRCVIGEDDKDGS